MSSKSTRLPYLLVLYEQYLDQQKSAAFANCVSRYYTCGTLERLAEHGSRDVRRAALSALGLLGGYDANHTMGRAMTDGDRTVRTIAQDAIRGIWAKAAGEAEGAELGKIVRLYASQLHAQAIARATKLIERVPWFAEAWYQRAASCFALGQFVEAIRDCHQALEINPYHFVAATTMGQAYLELQNPVSALECFRRALKLNPDLETIRLQVVRLARALEGNR